MTEQLKTTLDILNEKSDELREELNTIKSTLSSFDESFFKKLDEKLNVIPQ
jgi:hypothetical protein